MIALPRLLGPRLRGVPSDPLGFVPVDAFTRVRGRDGVHAVGDIAAHAVKQGGLAAQQADVAAAVIAAGAGRGRRGRGPTGRCCAALLLTGGEPRHLRHDPRGRVRRGRRAALVAARQDRGPPSRALPGPAPRARRAAPSGAGGRASGRRRRLRRARVARRGADPPRARRRPRGRAHRTASCCSRPRTASRSSPRPARSTRRCAWSRPTAPTCSCSTSTCRAGRACRRSPSSREQTAVVVLTMQNDPAFAREALQSGALGYVLKEAADAELVERGPRRRRRAARTSTRSSAPAWPRRRRRPPARPTT